MDNAPLQVDNAPLQVDNAPLQALTQHDSNTTMLYKAQADHVA
jgi:hypothetical protein